ncbi:MAG: hypothetical protein ACHQZS_10635 [Candidatus Binatales bacterium]
MNVIDREMSKLEASLGSPEELRSLASALSRFNAALLEGDRRYSRAALIHLRMRLERLAARIYRIQRAVENRIQTIRLELGDVG